MRKSLWITVLYATLVVPNAKADPITVNYDFECCNKAPATAKVTDLMVVFNAPVGADAGVDFGEAFGCDKVISTGLFNAIEVICTAITPGDHIDLTGVRSAASILSAKWSAADGKFFKATPVTKPVPEPATGGLMLLGFGTLMLKRNAQKSRGASWAPFSKWTIRTSRVAGTSDVPAPTPSMTGH